MRKINITPITSDEPTQQEIFDKAYLGVLRQGVPSKKTTGSCAYRGKNGTACGVGHLISDDVAKAWDERDDSAISDILSISGYDDNEDIYGVKYWMHKHSVLLDALQRAHDDAATDGLDFLVCFKLEMWTVAARFNLTIPKEV